MIVTDLPLSQRLERTEGLACRAYTEAVRQRDPASGAAWIEQFGTYAAFSGVDSPATQTFGLGLFEPLTEEALDSLEQFFLERGAPVWHEVSPLAGVAALDLLCRRQYRPVEISSVMYQPLDDFRADAAERRASPPDVRVVKADEAPLWTGIHARAWGEESPDVMAMIAEMGSLVFAEPETVCFLASQEQEPGATATLCIHGRTALLTGAATVPAMRRRGLQAALLETRLRYAAAQGCDLAMMVAEAGSASQRNAERNGFRIAYTRTKWRLQA